MHNISKPAQFHHIAIVAAEVKDLHAIRGLNGLLEHQEQLQDAGLSGAVGTKQPGDRRQTHSLDVTPRLEILYEEFGQHQNISFCVSTRRCFTVRASFVSSGQATTGLL